MKFTSAAAAALALAGNALAAPYNQYQVVGVTVTQHKTVYQQAGQYYQAPKPPKSTPCPEEQAQKPQYYGHPAPKPAPKPVPAPYHNNGPHVVTITKVYGGGYYQAPKPAPKPHHYKPKPRPHKPKPKPKPYYGQPPAGYAAPKPATKPKPKPSYSGSSNTGNHFNDVVLQTHNECRQAHGVSALTWDNTLAAYAAANMPSCNMQHTPNGIYGENLAYGEADPRAAVMMWVNEGKNYHGQGWDDQTGHYTQVVWKGTGRVGCAFRSDCNYLKCEYAAPGNVIGYFDQNVPA